MSAKVLNNAPIHHYHPNIDGIELGKTALTAYLIDPKTLVILELEIMLNNQLADIAMKELQGVIENPRALLVQNMQAMYEAMVFEHLEARIKELFNGYIRKGVKQIQWFHRDSMNLPRHRRRLLALFRKLGFEKVAGDDDQLISYIK